MTKRLAGKTAIITGGGSGIGRAISWRFAQEGATVHILELNAAAAEEVVGAIRDVGGDATVHPCDVSVQHDVRDIVTAIGPVDILVNNAGIAHVGNLEHTSEEDFDRIIRVNVKGAYNVLHAVVPLMKKQGGGTILNYSTLQTHHQSGNHCL